MEMPSQSLHSCKSQLSIVISDEKSRLVGMFEVIRLAQIRQWAQKLGRYQINLTNNPIYYTIISIYIPKFEEKHTY